MRSLLGLVPFVAVCIACGAGEDIKLTVNNKQLLDIPPVDYSGYSKLDSGIELDRFWYQTLSPKQLVTLESIELGDMVSIEFRGQDGDSFRFVGSEVLDQVGLPPLKGRRLWEPAAPLELQKWLRYSLSSQAILVSIEEYQVTTPLALIVSDFEMFSFASLHQPESASAPVELLASLNSFPSNFSSSSSASRNEIAQGFWEILNH